MYPLPIAGWRFAFLSHAYRPGTSPRRTRRWNQTGIAAFVETVSSCTRTTCCCIHQPRPAGQLPLRVPDLPKATGNVAKPGDAKSHLELPTRDHQRWQTFTLAPICNSYRSGDYVAIHPCGASDPVKSAGSMKSAGIRVFLCMYSAMGKTSDHTAVGTHSRFTSQDQSYAQSQIVASETFA
jgi:hypothetical protein